MFSTVSFKILWKYLREKFLFFVFSAWFNKLKPKLYYAKIDIFFHLSAICRHHQQKSRIAKYVEVHRKRNYKNCMTSTGGLAYRSPCCLAWHIERSSWMHEWDKRGARIIPRTFLLLRKNKKKNSRR